jgi:hypothetical protein
VNISNALGCAVFTQPIRVISYVNSLIPGLASTSSSSLSTTNIVTFVSANGLTGEGLAQYAFSYVANTKAGSHSYVTFWPGDSANRTHGPFLLAMDFTANISKTQMQYSYSSLGNYQALFFVSNPLGSMTFSLTVNVVMSMYGLYMGVDPMYSTVTTVGSTVMVSAYLEQGLGVTYTWLQNGNAFQSAPRLG